MNAGVLVGDVVVLLFGVFMCVGPLATRPSVQFGVRVPPGHARAPVILRERRAYQWRSVLVGIGALGALIALGGHVPQWPSRLIVVPPGRLPYSITADRGHLPRETTNLIAIGR